MLNKTDILKLLVGVITLLATGSAFSTEMVIPDDKKVIQFDTKLGVVTFAHEKHAGLSITECKTCHHKLEATDTVIKPCHECHEDKATEVLKAKNAFHTRCTGCHEYTVAGGQHAGPLKKKCKLCHIKQSD